MPNTPNEQWQNLAVRLTASGVPFTAISNDSGDVTHVTLTVTDLTRLLDGEIDVQHLIHGAPRQGFTYRGVSYVLIEEPDHTFGVWRTDSPGNFIVRGRTTAAAAKQDTLADIDALDRLLDLTDR
ncbi:hypothetical protein AB0D90_03720 [Streptomyces althioticus]|uniref:hypothetical protein n=1 Tax=Streptomyces althioticus TaxID=83380 RepID=UPI0033F2BAF7